MNPEDQSFKICESCTLWNESGATTCLACLAPLAPSSSTQQSPQSTQSTQSTGPVSDFEQWLARLALCDSGLSVSHVQRVRTLGPALLARDGVRLLDSASGLQRKDALKVAVALGRWTGAREAEAERHRMQTVWENRLIVAQQDAEAQAALAADQAKEAAAANVAQNVVTAAAAAAVEPESRQERSARFARAFEQLTASKMQSSM